MKPTYEQLEEQNSQLKHEFKMLQETSHLKYQELKRLEEENLRMREAIKYYAEGNIEESDETFVEGNSGTPDPGYWWSGKLARETLQSIPDTDQLAKQREADLKIVTIAKRIFDGLQEDIATVPRSYPHHDLIEVFKEREKVYGESN